MLLFFAGLILSIPLSLGVNLLTPSVQNRMARRSVQRATRRTEFLKRELADVSEYVTASDRLNRAMLSQILRISLVTSVGAAVVTGCFAAANVVAGLNFYLFTITAFGSYVSFYLNDLFNFLGFLLGTVTALIIIPLCLNMLRLNFRVDHFGDYSQGVEATIENLGSVRDPATGDSNTQASDP